MFRFIISFLVAFSWVGQATAQESSVTLLNKNAGWYDIKEVHIQKISSTDLDVQPAQYLSYANDCTSLGRTDGQSDFDTSTGAGGNLRADGEIIDVKPNPNPTPAPAPGPSPNKPGRNDEDRIPSLPTTRDGSPISLEQIINIGERVWKFLQDNRPVVSAKTMYANALPRGIQCWDELDSWQRPRSEVYRATYYNGFGMAVVNLEFRLVFTWGGQVNETGRYLTNVTVQYRKLDAAPFFNVDAEVEVPQVVNVGKRKSPVAGMQVSVRWKVRGLNHVERTASFFVYGDGRPTDVMN